MASGLNKTKLQLEPYLLANYNTASQAERVTLLWLFFTVTIFIFVGIKLKSLLDQSLQEQIDKNRVQRVYNQTVTAVKGLGTDTDAVLAAVKMIRNRDEFLEYMSKFKDNKSGYTTFTSMINAEYDRHNFFDVQKIVEVLRNIGIYAELTSRRVNTGNNLFVKFTIILSKKPPTVDKKQRDILKKQWLAELPKAIAFWKSWLSDPITQQRVQKNWDTWYASGKFLVHAIFPIYFQMLNKLRIQFYDYTTGLNMSWAYAFVTGTDFGPLPKIYVNLELDDPAKYDTLVHEIQHIIYDIKPLNPEKKITNAFVTKNTKRDTPDNIKSTVVSSAAKKLETNTLKAKSVITSLGLDMTPDQLLSWRAWALKDQHDDPGYVCRATEKMSNIMAVRNYFKLKPGQNITVAMLKPYIEEKKHHTDISWILGCWALNNFPDLNTMLNRINMLAKTDTNTTNNKGKSNLA